MHMSLHVYESGIMVPLTPRTAYVYAVCMLLMYAVCVLLMYAVLMLHKIRLVRVGVSE